MTFIPTNDATQAMHDAVANAGGVLRGFNRYWTARAVRLLRRLEGHEFIEQAHGSAGALDENGHGSVCANQALVELLDNLRNSQTDGSFGVIDRILPVSSSEIIQWNDEDEYSFAEIAEMIEERAGGPEALADA